METADRGFGPLLRAARLDAGLSQEALAEAAGLSARAISDLERGVNRAPRRGTLEALAAALRPRPAERTRWEAAWRAGQGDGTPAARPARNPPAPPTSSVGQGREAADVGQLLEESRLLTLTDPGGCGETRLALELAWTELGAHPDGVWFVELAVLADASVVSDAAAAALGLRGGRGQPTPSIPLAALRAPRLLLILDDREPLPGAC